MKRFKFILGLMALALSLVACKPEPVVPVDPPFNIVDVWTDVEPGGIFDEDNNARMTFTDSTLLWEVSLGTFYNGLYSLDQDGPVDQLTVFDNEGAKVVFNLEIEETPQERFRLILVKDPEQISTWLYRE